MLRRSIRSPSVPLDCVHRLTDAVKRGFSYSGSAQIVASRTLRPELPGANSAFTFRVLDQSCRRTGATSPKWMVALGRDPPARASICTDLPTMNQRHTDGLPLHAQELVVRSPSTPSSTNRRANSAVRTVQGRGGRRPEIYPGCAH